MRSSYVQFSVFISVIDADVSSHVKVDKYRHIEISYYITPLSIIEFLYIVC